MPLYGTLGLDPAMAPLAEMPHLDTEAWALPQAEILQLAWEVPRETRALLPPALHPAIPAYVTVQVLRCPESPVGPFALALCRLMCRAGAHPRGYALGAVASTAEAARALREGWGFPAVPGEGRLRRRHDRITAEVAPGGHLTLEAALLNPEPISGAEVQYIHTVTLARVADGGPTPDQPGAAWLVQVDPHYTLHRADRGRPWMGRFDPAAWNAGGLRLEWPISASWTTADTDLPQIRFVMDARVPVIQGTRRIR